jgi:hypothetical protein
MINVKPMTNSPLICTSMVSVRGRGWWRANLSAGPGWIVLGALKLLAGSFLAFLAIEHLVSPSRAAEPTQMYLVAFQYIVSSPIVALVLTVTFVIVSQIKINVTNAYAGSIAWSNFFSRLTHSHPGRVVWLVFNVAIALMLMELGIFKMLEHILGLYSIVAVAWIGALVSDLVINKPVGLSPMGIEFKRAHLYDINPVGVGSMLTAVAVGLIAMSGILGPVAQGMAGFLTLAIAFVMAPAIAYATRGRFYIARIPRRDWSGLHSVRCIICEHDFEMEDMAHCPAYGGAICYAVRSTRAAEIAANKMRQSPDNGLRLQITRCPRWQRGSLALAPATTSVCCSCLDPSSDPCCCSSITRCRSMRAGRVLRSRQHFGTFSLFYPSLRE